MTTITAKIQIYVSSDQSKNLIATTNAYRNACNWLSKHVFQTKILKQAKLNDLYYKQLRSQPS